jgi:hypothetical protein
MFKRAIRNLDQIQNSSTAHACEFDQSSRQSQTRRSSGIRGKS